MNEDYLFEVGLDNKSFDLLNSKHTPFDVGNGTISFEAGNDIGSITLNANNIVRDSVIVTLLHNKGNHKASNPSKKWVNQLQQDEESLKVFGNLNSAYASARHQTVIAVDRIHKVKTDKKELARYEKYFGKFKQKSYDVVVKGFESALKVYDTITRLEYDKNQWMPGTAAQAMHGKITFFPLAKSYNHVYDELLFHEIMHLGGIHADHAYGLQNVIRQAKFFPHRALDNADSYTFYAYD